MNFADVEKIAAAILYEGYILYPYRPTAIKNRQRWNFGTLYPRMYAEAQRPQEPFRFHAECLVEAATDSATLDLKLQCLQLLHQNKPPSPTRLTDPSLEWEEAIERTAQHQDLRLSELLNNPLTLNLKLETSLPHEQQRSLLATLTIDVEALPNNLRKLRLEVENTNPLPSGPETRRDEALPHAFVSAHLLLGLNGGQFVSLLDPSEIHHEAAAACSNTGVFPVLAGHEPDRSILLCSPIILYDYPKIAPESEGDFFDGTEMDEMLTLRVLTLTDVEKQEMREADPRARRILERTEALTPESLMKAHGTIRGLREIRGDAP